jgi:hypothetical protein
MGAYTRNIAILRAVVVTTVVASAFADRFGGVLAEGPDSRKAPHATSKPSGSTAKEVIAAHAENRKQLEQLLVLAQKNPGEIAGIRQALLDMARRAKLARFLLDSSPAERKALFALEITHPKIVLSAFSSDIDVQIKALYAISELPVASFRQAEPLVARGLLSAVPGVQIAAANSILGRGIVVSRKLRESMLAALSRPEPREWSKFIDTGKYIEGNMTVLRQIVLAVISVRDLQMAKGIVKLLSQRKGRCINRSMWLCYILQRIADRKIVPDLAKVLSDKTQRKLGLRHWLDPPSGPKIVAFIAPSDAILQTLLHITGQAYDKYDFEMKIEFTYTKPAFYGFASSTYRSQAMDKFNAWWSEHKGEFLK